MQKVKMYDGNLQCSCYRRDEDDHPRNVLKTGDKIIFHPFCTPVRVEDINPQNYTKYFVVKGVEGWNIKLQEILQPRVSQKYEIPGNSPWGKVIKSGRSGILSRRDYLLPFSFSDQEVYVLLQSDKDEEDLDLELAKTILPFPVLDDWEQKQTWLNEQQAKSIRSASERMIKELFDGRNYDVVSVKEFNKTPLAKHLPEGYIVLHVYHTTCGNETVVIGKRQTSLRVPDDLKGLIIGKRGGNIKSVSEKLGYRIQVL